MSLSFDKKTIQKNFSRGAKNYDELALIQKLVAKNLCEIAKPFIKQNFKILDLGSGTSFVAKNFFEQKNIEIFELDLSLEMLKSQLIRPKNTFAIQGDFEKLPFKKQSFDILISSFSMQWLKNFEKNFGEFFAFLKDGGKLIFALPTHGSLHELKAAEAFSFIDFPKISELKLAARKSQFRELFFEEKILTQEFPGALDCLKLIKKIGANYSKNRSKLITKSTLKKLDSFCLKNFADKNKSFSSSWVVSSFIFTK